MSTRDKVYKIIKGFAINGVEIDDESNLSDTLHFDSLDYMQSIIDLEAAFPIEIEDHIASTWETVGDVVRYIEGKVDDPN